MVNFYPCENHFDYNSLACGSACYLLYPLVNTATWIYCILTPLIIMIISNFFLIVRVIYQKRQMLQRNVWKKNKKMILQLLSITGVLYISWVPSSITSIINALQSNPILQEIQEKWLLLGLIYVAVLLSPLSITIAIPELRKEILLQINRWKRRYANARTYPATL